MEPKGLFQDVTGFVLAGGHSQRMGTDKALLPLEGEYLIWRPIRSVQNLIQDVRIIGDPERYRSLGLPVIPDCVVSRGPLSGIYTALRHSPTPYALIVACDMPLIHHEFFRLLLERFREVEVVLMRFNDGQVEPLCSLYSRSCLPAIETSLAEGRFKVSDFFESVRIAYVTEAELHDAGLSRGIFSNLNTRGELEGFTRTATSADSKERDRP